MESVFGRNKKVLIDTNQSGNVLYLPLDQITGKPSSQNGVIPPLVGTDSAAGGDPSNASRAARREGRQ